MGQLTTSQPTLPGLGTLHPTTYAYDPAGNLASITADGVTTSFAIDALGRHAGQTIGAGATTTYAYLGTSDTISSASQSGTVSYSGIDAVGDRLTTGTPSAFGWLLADLHGNVVAVMTAGSGPSYTTAYRYDAYGETCDTYSSGSGAISSPWRFQGRILESASGSTDLYDFAARSYDPSLGAFTSFDSTTGSAQNPLTLNRYLYANANPATLVDPDGHAVLSCRYGREDCDAMAKKSKSGSPTVMPPPPPTAAPGPPPVLKVLRTEEIRGTTWELIDFAGTIEWTTETDTPDVSCGAGCTMHWEVQVTYQVSSANDQAPVDFVTSNNGFEVDLSGGTSIKSERKSGDESTQVTLTGGENKIQLSGGVAAGPGGSAWSNVGAVSGPSPEFGLEGYGYTVGYKNETTVTPEGAGPTAQLTVDTSFHQEWNWPKIDGPNLPKITVPNVALSPAAKAAILESFAMGTILIAAGLLLLPAGA